MVCYFDEYKEYDNHDIEDFTMYLVEVHSSDVCHSILFPTVYYRCFGLKLKLCKRISVQFKIHAFRRPCNLEDVDFNEPIQKVYSNNKLSTTHKKFIVNKTTGLCEKKYNTAHICKVFDNFAEAQHYQLMYEGKIHTLQQSFTSTQTVNQSEDPLNFGLDMSDFEENKTVTNVSHSKKIYLVIIEKKETLTEGYRYIKELIYDMMSIKMYKLYNEVLSKGITPKGIKTDAILISKSKPELEKLFTFSNNIGGVKFESGKYCPNKKVTQLLNEPFNIKNRIVNEITILDEYDKKEINHIFDNHSRV
ncbi:MAG TPA: hypothetical protein PLS50_07485, partial [Candidatus Dojkabacteria bacterium]|nr:hypothetical protein [Candidatus Dojkabacteria bacterium]